MYDNDLTIEILSRILKSLDTVIYRFAQLVTHIPNKGESDGGRLELI